MDKIIEQILESISNGNMIAFLVIVVTSLIFNFEKIFSFLDSRRVIKIQMIEEAINSQHVNGATKSYLETLIETEYFKRITGIYLEREIREALLLAHQRTNGELKFKHFKRAIPHIFYEDKKLSIKINKFSIVGLFYNCIFGFPLLFFGITLFILPVFSQNVTLTSLFSAYGVGSLFMAIGAWMVMESAPIISAIKVRRQIEKLEVKSKVGIDRQAKKEPDPLSLRKAEIL